MTSASPDSSQSPDMLASLRIDRSDARRGSGVWRILKIVVVLLLIAGLGFGGFVMAQKAGWLPESFQVPDMIKSRTKVNLASVTIQTGRSGDATVVATGYLESRRQAQIGARMPGRIQVIHVEEGARVKTDEVMAVLEHADMDAALAAAQATLARAKAEKSEQEIEIARTKRTYDRMEKLQKGTVSEADYDLAHFAHQAAVARLSSLEAAIDLAEARVKESEQMRENMYIRAPFDGTVISKQAEVGESILPGGMGEASGRGSVVTIADLDHLEVDCDVKEDFIGRVSVGQITEVAVDAVPDRRYQGRVRKIIPMGDRARATIKVKVEIVNADERLFPDMGSTVYFLPPAAEKAKDEAEAKKKRVFCPSAAITSDDAGKFVWVVNAEDRLQRRDIAAGKVQDDRTEILSGLSGDEQVVINPPETLRADELIKR